MVEDFHVAAGGMLSGDGRVPGDKSISHRAVILSAIGDGASTISSILEGADVLATITAFRQMGVKIDGPVEGELTIQGVGRLGLNPPAGDLDLGNSGTAMRLLAGLLSAQPFSSQLVGDESLSRRPMLRVVGPLRDMGAKICAGKNGTPPLKIAASGGLRAIDYRMPMASAQVKSAILLAGLYATGETSVLEPAPTRDHTERMLTGVGYPCKRKGRRISIRGGGNLPARNLEIPGDVSSAAFFIVGAAIAPGSSICLRHVGVNDTRVGLIDILRQMGARIELRSRRYTGGEPVADIVVDYTDLHGVEVSPDKVPLAIDEFPALCIAAACADGRTVIRGAAELRHKESDRIKAVVVGLESLGIDVTEFEDGLDIQGGRFSGGLVDSFGDHRIAMSFSIAALRAEAAITVSNCANVGTSFPGFVSQAARFGLRIDG